MQIIEISRVSQLANFPKSVEIFNSALTETGISVEALTDEIASVIDSMSTADFLSAANWYADAFTFANELAIEFDTSLSVVAGIISAVSPRMPWLRNKSVARSILAEFKKYPFLSAEDAAKEIALGLGSNVTMAIKIARGEEIADVLTGTKRRSFYNNIVAPFDGDSVTVDTWMVRAIMSITRWDLKPATDFLRKHRVALGGTGAGYIAIAEAVRAVARDGGYLPSQIQAAYWTAISGSMDGGRTDIS